MSFLNPASRFLAAVWLLSALLLRAATVDLLVLQTSDLHGRIGPGRGSENGDWLRLASVIRRMRWEHGPERALLIDCGDTVQGSLAASLTRGEIALALLRDLSYDVWVPGNHEFDFGCRRLLEMCRSGGVPVLCGNLELLDNGAIYRPAPWRMVSLGGASVAVIGVTASYLDQWLWGDDFRDFHVTTAVDALAKLIPDVMRRNPDLIILAAHQGWLQTDRRSVNEIALIAEQFPEIDLILGGHTHMTVPGLRIGPETWYVQPGAHATYVAAIDVKVDTEAHRVVDISSQLVAGAEAAVDPQAQRAVADSLAKSLESARTPICRLETAVSAVGTPGVSCQTSELICRAMAEATHAHVVLHGRLSRSGLLSGPVRGEDLFALIPYENTIVLAELTPRELEAVVAEQLTQRSSYAYCGVWGAEFEIFAGKTRGDDDAGSGATVRLVGAPAEQTRILVALNSYTAAGGGGRFPRLRAVLRTPQARLRDTGTSSREAVGAFLHKHAGEAFPARRWIHGVLSAFDGESASAGAE